MLDPAGCEWRELAGLDAGAQLVLHAAKVKEFEVQAAAWCQVFLVTVVKLGGLLAQPLHRDAVGKQAVRVAQRQHHAARGVSSDAGAGAHAQVGADRQSGRIGHGSKAGVKGQRQDEHDQPEALADQQACVVGQIISSVGGAAVAVVGVERRGVVRAVHRLASSTGFAALDSGAALLAGLAVAVQASARAGGAVVRGNSFSIGLCDR